MPESDNYPADVAVFTQPAMKQMQDPLRRIDKPPLPTTDKEIVQYINNLFSSKPKL